MKRDTFMEDGVLMLPLRRYLKWRKTVLSEESSGDFICCRRENRIQVRRRDADDPLGSIYLQDPKYVELYRSKGYSILSRAHATGNIPRRSLYPKFRVIQYYVTPYNVLVLYHEDNPPSREDVVKKWREMLPSLEQEPFSRCKDLDKLLKDGVKISISHTKYIYFKSVLMSEPYYRLRVVVESVNGVKCAYPIDYKEPL